MAIYYEYHPGRVIFVTLAAHKNMKILHDKVSAIRQGWDDVAKRHDIEVIAYAILPNHIHYVVDTQQISYNTTLHSFKLFCGKHYHATHVTGRKPLWDPSAFIHVLRSKKEIERHIDFVHYNPVRHGLAKMPWDWSHSSFRNFVKHGYYFKDWTLDHKAVAKLKELDDTDVPTTE